MSDRRELVRNAVSFLADPKTQSSPVSQRVQFLEAKGLTSAEIDDAMKEAALLQGGPSYSHPYRTPYPYTYPPSAYSIIGPPLRQPWDWRDYFIMTVVSGGVVYGAVALARKYLLPHLRPPTATAYEEDRDALTAQFDAAEALLKQIQAETAAIRLTVDQQQEKVDKATRDVEAVVKELSEGESKSRDEVREIREEVNTIREMLPKMMEKNKESHSQSLAELQQELKSLKALLLSRGPAGSSTPPPVFPGMSGRPSIPAWQLAGASSSASSSAPSTAALPSPSTVGSVIPAGSFPHDVSGSRSEVDGIGTPTPINGIS